MRDYSSKRGSNNNIDNPKINPDVGNPQAVKRYPFGNKPFAYLNSNDDNERNDTEMGNPQNQANFKDNLGENFFKRQSRGTVENNNEQEDKNLSNFTLTRKISKNDLPKNKLSLKMHQLISN